MNKLILTLILFLSFSSKEYAQSKVLYNEDLNKCYKMFEDLDNIIPYINDSLFLEFEKLAKSLILNDSSLYVLIHNLGVIYWNSTLASKKHSDIYSPYPSEYYRTQAIIYLNIYHNKTGKYFLLPEDYQIRDN